MEQLKRSNNIVIHGKQEDTTEINDKDWVTNLINGTRTHVTVKFITRLGAAAEGKKRPILFALKNSNDRKKILSNLRALKEITRYKGISGRPVF